MISVIEASVGGSVVPQMPNIFQRVGKNQHLESPKTASSTCDGSFVSRPSSNHNNRTLIGPQKGKKLMSSCHDSCVACCHIFIENKFNIITWWIGRCLGCLTEIFGRSLLLVQSFCLILRKIL